MEEEKKAEVKIEIDENTALGSYVNLAMIGHSEDEFIIDFIFLPPRSPKAKVRSRIITSPGHVKRLLAALQENLAKYESRFGEIKAAPKPENVNGVGFYH